MSEIAVSWCTFQASLDTGAGTISAVLSTSTQASSKVLVDSKGVYFDKITVTVGLGTSVVLTSVPEGASANTGTIAEVGSIDINGTASDVLDSSSNVAVQKNDSGSKKLTFIFPSTVPPSYTVLSDVNVTVKVSDAGQTYVIAS